MTDHDALGSWPLRDVAVPSPGSPTTRQILSAALRRTMRGLVSVPTAGIDAVEVAAYRDLVAVLAGMARAEPGALASLVRRPNVGTLVRALQDPARGDLDRPSCLRQLVGAVTAELVDMPHGQTTLRTTSFAAGWTWWARRARVSMPEGAEALVLRGGALMAEVGGRQVAVGVETADSAGPLFAAIDETAWLCRADDSPLAHLEAHPDKEGNAVDLGGRSVATWTEALRAALDLIDEFFPPMRADIRLVLQQVIPVGYDAQRHSSASFAENLGTVYASLHDDPMTMAEAVIHEVSHNKLNALLDLDPLLHNAFSTGHVSPVRPDPRPLHGILLAVHALLPVAELYARMKAARHPWSQGAAFERRYAQIVAGNREGTSTLLSKGRPTAVGDKVLAEFVARTTAE
jgi:HEXXH motif-containing protein